MKKNKKIMLLLFAIICSLGLSAQNLVLTLNNSTIETFPIANIQSIKFGTSSMILNQSDGTVNTWNIQDINNYAFDGLTGVKDLITVSNSNLTIYPNPAIGLVNIQYTTGFNTFITIEIIDANGKPIQQVYQGEHNSSQLYTWDANVPKGIYYCRISTDNKSISKPIIIK
jgi:hypothetical protein